MKKLRCTGENLDGTRCKREKEVDNAVEEFVCFQHGDKTDKTADVGKRKMNEKEKEWILKWLADFETPTQIVYLIQDNFGKSISTSTISDYKARYKEKIDAIRVEMNQNIATDIIYANKYQRVKKLKEVINKAEKTSDWKNVRLCLKDIAEEMKELSEDSNDSNIEAYIKALGSTSNIWDDN